MQSIQFNTFMIETEGQTSPELILFAPLNQ